MEFAKIPKIHTAILSKLCNRFQGKVKHIKAFLKLEEQLCGYVPEVSSKSPDRLDALVWGLTDLFLAGEAMHEYKAWV